MHPAPTRGALSSAAFCSVVHLRAVIEELEAKGAHFRSLHDAIDTTTPQGMFSLQVHSAVAQLARASIAECTRAGLRASCDATCFRRVIAGLGEWLPIVQQLRRRSPGGSGARAQGDLDGQAAAPDGCADRSRRDWRSRAGSTVPRLPHDDDRLL